MSLYLLDTNAAIALMKGHPNIVAQIERVGVTALRLCAPVEAELWFGVFKSTWPERNAAKLRELLSWLPTLPFAGDATHHAGEIRAHLGAQGTPIGPYDVQIAAIARANDLTVVTRNTREFERVPGLLLANWQD